MADRSMARWVEDLIEAMRVLTGPDGIDPTVPDVPYRDPAQVNLAELRVGVLSPITERGRRMRGGRAWFGERRGACLRGSLRGRIPPGLSGGGLRPGDELNRSGMAATGLRDYLRELGSSEVHPLLTAWLDNWSRIARIWPAWRILGRAGRRIVRDDRFLATAM